MTYLQLCQRVHLLLRLGSRGNTAKPGTVPTSTAGQVDELAEIVEYVKYAWQEIQNEQRWGWLIGQGTLAFGAAVATVTPTSTISTFGEWMPFVEPCGMGTRAYALSYLTADSTTEHKVYFEPFDVFRGFRDQAAVATGRPIYFTIRPNMDWTVYPTPTASTTLRFDYIARPKVLATSDGAVNIEDHPATGKGLPGHFQDVIAWHAVRQYAGPRGDGALYQIASKRYQELMMPIKRAYLPEIRL